MDTLFKVPEIVKVASEEMLSCDAPGAIVIGDDLRIDNPAAAWCAGAKLRKDAALGKPVSKYASGRVQEALNLFDLGEDAFQLKDMTGHHILVKTASDIGEFFIENAEHLNEAAAAVIEKRASAPLGFCRDCANQILNCAEQNGFDIAPDVSKQLSKIASTMYFDSVSAKQEINKRKNHAINSGQSDYADRMRKLASLCETHAGIDTSPIVTVAIADVVDEFDRQFGLLGKHASVGMRPFEQVAFLTATEALVKKASERVYVDDTLSVSEGVFYPSENLERMVKWASGHGYTSTEDRNDIIDCVSSMPGSLREEFCELFA